MLHYVGTVQKIIVKYLLYLHSMSIYAMLYSLANIFFITSFSYTPITFSTSMYILQNLTHLYEYINCCCCITYTKVGNTFYNISNVIGLPSSVIIIVSMFYVTSCYTKNYCYCMLLNVYKFCYYLTLTNAECSTLLSLMSSSYKELLKHKYSCTNEKDGAGSSYCSGVVVFIFWSLLVTTILTS